MRRDPRTVIGLLLILAGVLFGLQELNLISGELEDPIFALSFGVGMIFFLSSFAQDRRRWWAALAGLILLALTLLKVSEMALPGFADQFGGALLLGVIALAFLVVFAIDRAMWWALIPGGVLFSLTTMLVVEELVDPLPFDSAGILFIGMGLTFLIINFLTVDGERMNWAIFPALPLLVFGLFIGFSQQALWDYIWPSLLVLGGLYFLVSSLRRG